MISMTRLLKSMLGSAVALAGVVAFTSPAHARTVAGSSAVPFLDFAPGGTGQTGANWSCVAEASGHLKNTCSVNIVEEVPLTVDAAGTYSPNFSLSSGTQCIAVALNQSGAIVSNTGWQRTSTPGPVSVPAFGALYGACEIQPNGAILL